MAEQKPAEIRPHTADAPTRGTGSEPTKTEVKPGSEVKPKTEAKPEPELSPEEKDKKIQEENKKSSEERQKVVDEIINGMRERLEKYGSGDMNSILDEIKWRIGTMWVCAAGADMGTPTPQTVKELTEEHTPYITPPVRAGITPFANIAPHVAEMEESEKDKGKSGEKKKEEPKKAA